MEAVTKDVMSTGVACEIGTEVEQKNSDLSVMNLTASVRSMNNVEAKFQISYNYMLINMFFFSIIRSQMNIALKVIHSVNCECQLANTMELKQCDRRSIFQLVEIVNECRYMNKYDLIILFIHGHIKSFVGISRNL